jgi:hypothetical protein
MVKIERTSIWKNTAFQFQGRIFSGASIAVDIKISVFEKI